MNQQHSGPDDTEVTPAETPATESFLLVSADLRIVGASPDQPSALPADATGLVGLSLSQVLPQLAASLVDQASVSPNAWLQVAAASASTDGGQAMVQVQVTPLHGAADAPIRWLLRLRPSPARPAAVSLLLDEEGALSLAKLLRVEPQERIASSLAHDLNNTFQTLIGSLWLLEDLLALMPLARTHLSRLDAACKQGTALVQQQSEMFRRKTRLQSSLAEIIRETVPALRRLLGDGQRLLVNVLPAAEHVVVERRATRQLLLLLLHFLGGQAPPGSTIEIAALLCPASSRREETATSQVEPPAAGGVRLSVSAQLAGPHDPALLHGGLSFPHPLWASRRLAQHLGARLHVDEQAQSLTFAADFSSEVAVSAAT